MGEREIIRTSYGKSRPRIDFPRLANLYMNGELFLDEMISKTYKIEQINYKDDIVIPDNILQKYRKQINLLKNLIEIKSNDY